MFRTWRQAVVIASVLLLAAAWIWVLAMQLDRRVIDAGFWFEPVTYETSEAQADRLGGAITEQEMQTIAAHASAEITRAFAGLRIAFSDRRDERYRVRVVQDLRNSTYPRSLARSGESRAIAGLGGQGAVSFRSLANNAIAHARPDADRVTMIAAIGRGIGAAAVHEFAHQLLGTAPLHDTTDVQSYEYRSADRREQYYSALHWDLAWPMLQKRIGTVTNHHSSSDDP
jgi:elongation factor P hydroxylase